MKCFGYTNLDREKLLTLSEITFQADAKELRNLISFLTKCVDEMESNSGWEHEHLSDFSPNSKESVDIIVFRNQ